MGILDKLRFVAKQAKDYSASAASSAVTDIWNKFGQNASEEVVRVASQAASFGASYIADDEKYRTAVIDSAWEILPTPVRRLGRERLGWDSALMSLRSVLFVIDGESVAVHPDAKTKVAGLITDVVRRARPPAEAPELLTVDATELESCPLSGSKLQEVEVHNGLIATLAKPIDEGDTPGRPGA